LSDTDISDRSIVDILNILGLNMFLVLKVSVKIEISPFSKFLTNLVFHL